MENDPPYLTVGTEVSAKYKGAFCEAKIKKVVRVVKCKVTFKSGLGSSLLSDEHIKGSLRVGGLVEARHPDKNTFIDAVVNKIQDCSQYTVVFDDGDITTLRRSALCLKSGRHFNESETLDQLPLTHPEHFSNPVVGGRRNVRRRTDLLSDTGDGDESSDEESSIPCKKGKKSGVERNEVYIGKVVCVENTENKKKTKDSWFPGLIVSPLAQEAVKIKTKDDCLVRSFRDGRYYTVPKKEVKDFSKDLVTKAENSNLLKAAIEKAVQFIEKKELPPHWDKDTLFFTTEEILEDPPENSEDSGESEEETQGEEKDRFVAQLYKFMDDRGTPINKVPTVCGKDLDLYKLFKIVTAKGGYNKVTNSSQWKPVTIKMGYSTMPTTSTINLVKQGYKKFLHNFEEFYRKLGCSLNPPSGSSNISRSNRNMFRDRHSSSSTPPHPPPQSTKDSKNSPPPPPPQIQETIKEEEEEEEEVEISTKVEIEPSVETELSDADSKASYDITDESPRRSRSRQDVTKGSNSSSSKRSDRSSLSRSPNKRTRLLSATKTESVCSTDSTLLPDPLPDTKNDSTKTEPKTDPKIEGNVDKSSSSNVSESTPLAPPPSTSLSGTRGGRGKYKRKSGGGNKEGGGGGGGRSYVGENVPIETGNTLYVYYGEESKGKMYKAKVVDVNGEKGLYFVHYAGWNTRYDEWVPRSRIAENLTLRSGSTISNVNIINQGRGPSQSSVSDSAASNSDSSTHLNKISSPKGISRKKNILSPTTHCGRKRLTSEGQTSSPSPPKKSRKRATLSGIESGGDSSESEDIILATPKRFRKPKKIFDPDASPDHPPPPSPPPPPHKIIKEKDSSLNSPPKGTNKDSSSPKDRKNQQVIDLNKIRSELKGLDKMVLNIGKISNNSPDVYEFEEDASPPKISDKKESFLKEETVLERSGEEQKIQNDEILPMEDSSGVISEKKSEDAKISEKSEISESLDKLGILDESGSVETKVIEEIKKIDGEEERRELVSESESNFIEKSDTLITDKNDKNLCISNIKLMTMSDRNEEICKISNSKEKDELVSQSPVVQLPLLPQMPLSIKEIRNDTTTPILIPVTPSLSKIQRPIILQFPPPTLLPSPSTSFNPTIQLPSFQLITPTPITPISIISPQEQVTEPPKSESIIDLNAPIEIESKISQLPIVAPVIEKKISPIKTSTKTKGISKSKNSNSNTSETAKAHQVVSSTKEFEPISEFSRPFADIGLVSKSIPLIGLVSKSSSSIMPETSGSFNKSVSSSSVIDPSGAKKKRKMKSQKFIESSDSSDETLVGGLKKSSKKSRMSLKVNQTVEDVIANVVNEAACSIPEPPLSPLAFNFPPKSTETQIHLFAPGDNAMPLPPTPLFTTPIGQEAKNMPKKPKGSYGKKKESPPKTLKSPAGPKGKKTKPSAEKKQLETPSPSVFKIGELALDNVGKLSEKSEVLVPEKIENKMESSELFSDVQLSKELKLVEEKTNILKVESPMTKEVDVNVEKEPLIKMDEMELSQVNKLSSFNVDKVEECILNSSLVGEEESCHSLLCEEEIPGSPTPTTKNFDLDKSGLFTNIDLGKSSLPPLIQNPISEVKETTTENKKVDEIECFESPKLVPVEVVDIPMKSVYDSTGAERSPPSSSSNNSSISGSPRGEIEVTSSKKQVKSKENSDGDSMECLGKSSENAEENSNSSESGPKYSPFSDTTREFFSSEPPPRKRKNNRHSSPDDNFEIKNNEDKNVDFHSPKFVYAIGPPPVCERFNFIPILDETMSQSQRIEIIAECMSSLREEYREAKSDLLLYDRKRKRIRRRERERERREREAFKNIDT